MMISRNVLMTAAVLAVGPLSVSAQTVNAMKLPSSFDVVSVRVNNSGGRGFGIDVEKNSFTATNVSLMDLIAEAYGVKSNLVLNAPGWVSSLRFDVQAKVLDGENVDLQSFSDKEREPILQAVLVDRFQLKMHTETKTLPVYELVTAKGGAKVKETALVGDAIPHDGSYSVRNGEIDGHSVRMVSIAGTLTEVVRRKVIDKTGLNGAYDIDLKWTPEEERNSAKDSGAMDSPPPIFTALQEQLGLKLQAGKGPVETLVVDRAEKPTEN